jgi:hypothetical protein
MSTRADVRRIALALPEATEAEDGFGFSVLNGQKRKSFAWAWRERIEPGKPRVENKSVIAVRVPRQDKEILISSDPEKFFTEPHYNGFPAVLVRLEAVGTKELRELLTDAWRCVAPRKLVEDLESRTGI